MERDRVASACIRVASYSANRHPGVRSSQHPLGRCKWCRNHGAKPHDNGRAKRGPKQHQVFRERRSRCRATRLKYERMFGIMNGMSRLGGVHLEVRIGRLAAQIHAATAELVQLAADLDAEGSWADIGVRSCAHWLSINIGVDVRTGGEMLRAGHALAELPRIAAAFAEGRLSFDKIRAVTRVATPDDELV